MSGMFGFSREAVRIKVRKFEGSAPLEYRKFSVDPQITSFEVLQSLLDKAFDIKGEFTICYRVYDENSHDVYMPLLTDLDLEAAFLKADNISIANKTESCLCLRVEIKPFEECSEEWEQKNSKSIIRQVNNAYTGPSLHGIFNQVGKTLNLMQRSLNFGDDSTISIHPPRPPINDLEFNKFLNNGGQIRNNKELRSIIYLGGIDPSLRKVLWKFILNVYPDGLNGKERISYIKKKASEYMSLREVWKNAITQGPVVGELAYTTSMVRKDVLRTDRHHPFYAGSDDNQNIASLFNILTTYALNHPKVSYCQGMSDLASPLLVTMGDEAQAYICFCALMSRLSSNFMMDGIAMTQKFTHLAEGLLYYDAEFYNYLKLHQADDLLFCYRWLLLEMKREFAFDDSLRMLEVLWSSLPASSPPQELQLYDVLFQQPPPVTPSPQLSQTPPAVVSTATTTTSATKTIAVTVSHNSLPIKTPRENPYTKVCALRRQSSSVSLVNYCNRKVAVVKRQNHSLDETVGWGLVVKSPVVLQGQSLDDNATVESLVEKSTHKDGQLLRLKSGENGRSEGLRPRSVSPLEPKSDSVLLNNRINRSDVGKNKNAGLSSSMTSLIKLTTTSGTDQQQQQPRTKRGGHFQGLKERIAASGRMGIFSSLDTLDNEKSAIKEEGSKPRTRMVKNLNEFMHFASVNKNKISDKFTRFSNESAGDKPKIMLTKSSFDDSESSSVEKNSPTVKRQCSSTSTNSYDDTFDDYSPDDSQEYFPMTTSVTRELKIEMENLDRQVFGSKYTDRLLESDSQSSECCTDINSCNCDSQKLLENNSKKAEQDCANIELPNENIIPTSSNTLTQQHRSKEDVFLWENPLHQPATITRIIPPIVTVTALPNYIHTPDEQADLDYDTEEVAQIVDESSATKTVTPIKIIHNPPQQRDRFLPTKSSENGAEIVQKSSARRHSENTYAEDRTETFTSDKPQLEDTVAVNKCEDFTNTIMSASCTQLDLLKQETVTRMTNSCEEITESQVKRGQNNCGSGSFVLPPPQEFGGGNPFLMFLCLAVLLQHREQIIRTGMDYNEMAMHFDKMVRKHNVTNVLNQARQMHARYMKQHTSLAEKKKVQRYEGC